MGDKEQCQIQKSLASMGKQNRVELVFECRHGNKRMKNVKEVLMK